MQISRSESLKSLNTLALEARAAALTTAASEAEVREALRWAKAEGLPVLALGEGSNIVFAGEVEALLLRQQGLGWEVLSQDEAHVRLRVSAGEDWHNFVREALGEGWYGLENLALIPGTVGAAPIQNIGAYGVEFERFVLAVHAVDSASGESLRLGRDECRFAYRDSIFKGELRDRVIVTAVDIQLSTRPQVHCEYPSLAAELCQRGIARPAPLDVFEAVVAVRSRRLPDPAREPNAGSFFKNPVVPAATATALSGRYPGIPEYPQADGQVKLAAAWLIEQAGWKGFREGPLGIHPEHALVMVNYGGGTGAELLALAGRVVQSVSETFGIALEMEPRVYGQPR